MDKILKSLQESEKQHEDIKNVKTKFKVDDVVKTPDGDGLISEIYPSGKIEVVVADKDINSTDVSHNLYSPKEIQKYQKDEDANLTIYFLHRFKVEYRYGEKNYLNH